MSEYRVLLALQYFMKNGNNYSLSNLAERLGITIVQLDDLISELKGKKYIQYSDYELTITNKGIVKLINNNMANSSSVDISTQRDKSQKVSIYVPKNFTGE